MTESEDGQHTQRLTVRKVYMGPMNRHRTLPDRSINIDYR